MHKETDCLNDILFDGLTNISHLIFVNHVQVKDECYDPHQVDLQMFVSNVKCMTPVLLYGRIISYPLEM